MENLITAPHPDSAGSDSSTPSCSSSTSYFQYYDVFINHRGPDVKDTLASDLYRRLISNGLTVFLDREVLEEGFDITSQIKDAIRVASVHVAIFSPTYAESPWCLDELVLMVNSGAIILPVFYKVEPSVVRWTAGAYGEALHRLQAKTTLDIKTGVEKPRYDSDTIQNWRNALSHVADKCGFVLHGNEVELLDKVVRSVFKNIPKTPLDMPRYPTGLDLKLQEFQTMVLSKQQETERVEAKVVGVVGIGGVGKTTFAKEFFNRESSCYTASSFLSDVREDAARRSLHHLQSKLIKDLTHKDINIGPHAGIGIFRKHLLSCHVLIILDDVDHVSQVEAFLPIKNILSRDSLILVTSRDKHVLKSSGVLEVSIYNLEGLNTPHSKELFCSYAFNKPLPAPEFEDLADLFVTACDGLPLSLKVFGALVCGINDKHYWEELLDRLRQTLPVEILKRLRISYDSLHEEDQRIFLDIACFFIGEDRDKAIKIWGAVGLQNLENKCVLQVDRANKIKMHDHIRDLGRIIAQEESMPRRVWRYTTNTIDDWLEQSSCTITEVGGIKTINTPDTYWDIRTISEMSRYKRKSDELLRNSGHGCILNLRLVATEDFYLECILRRVQSPNLIWLCWYKCPDPCLPSWIPMKNLKVLEVAGMKLKMLWERQSQAPLELRELNIHAPLAIFPKSIGQLKHLEKIVMYHPKIYSIPLVALPEEFCDLRSLKYLELKMCRSMMSLPDSFGKLTNLEHIDLAYASSLRMLPDNFGHLSRLKHLSLFGCSKLTISNGTLGNITTLEFLDLSFCRKVKELPSQVAHQRHLGELFLGGTDLKELPGGIGDLCNLKGIKLGGNLLEELPPHLGYLKSLNDLSVFESPKLTLLPDSFGPLSRLRDLFLDSCRIEYLSQDFAMMKSLESLYVRGCPLRELPWKRVEGETGEKALNNLMSTDGKCMLGLKKLILQETRISEVGFPMGVCSNLQRLFLDSCPELRQIGGFCDLGKLQSLRISRCDNVKKLSRLEPLISLEQLRLERCYEIKSLEGLGQLTKLRELRVHDCCEIEELSGVEHVMSLKRLSVMECPKLKWRRGVLEQLQQQLMKGFHVESKNPIIVDC